MNAKLSTCIENLNRGSLANITMELCDYMNKLALEFLSMEEPSKEDIENAYGILLISNILYNNTTRTMLPLEDGVYDILVTRYNALTNGSSPVGAPPIVFDPVKETVVGGISNEEVSGPIEVVRRVDTTNMLYFRDIVRNHYPLSEFYDYSVPKSNGIRQNKGTVGHDFPELSGTLDKCKYVLNCYAEMGEYGTNRNDVWTFEENFMHQIYAVHPFDALVCELKYDGISVTAKVDGNTIVSAVSRGDTANDETTDLTRIFGGYIFPRAKDIPALQPGQGTVFGIQFECIVTNYNLEVLSKEFGLNYANARVAVIGLTSREDARRFLPFLTLVPIRTAGLNINERQTEIEFLNKYFSTDVDMKYAIMRGDYNQLLFQVKRFVDDAKTLRPYMPFLYDGVVVSLIDPNLIRLIGRYKSVNKWSIAIKFEAEVKQTIFLGYEFTIGQNGVVTPMAKIRPVAFMGNIQSKISVHSYKRFQQLALKVGDTVTVEFRHDVMAYLTKPDTPYNRSNPNPVVPFPTNCPFCGAPLSTLSEKEAVCVNKLCPERNLMRVTNMLAKLNIKDFGKELIRKLGITSLRDFITYDCNKAEQILNSKVMAMKLHARIDELYKKPMPDYRLMGAIGFTSIAQSKWKLIMSQVSVEAILKMDDNELRNTLKAIKGIGPIAADTIVSERAYMYKDIVMIANMPCVERTYGRVDTRVQVRFTGVRDAELEELFNNKGFDADGTKGVTKKTMILVVPYVGFQSSKTQKANPNCVFMDPTMARNYLNNIR